MTACQLMGDAALLLQGSFSVLANTQCHGVRSMIIHFEIWYPVDNQSDFYEISTGLSPLVFGGYSIFYRNMTEAYIHTMLT